MADIKTSKLVEPAEINGSGKPVGGIEPVTTAMLRITCIPSIAPIPKQRNVAYLFDAFKPTLNIVIINIK